MSNAAQRLHESIGVAIADTKVAHGSKNGSATKSGPGRFAQYGAPGTRITKPHPLRAFAALMAAWASKRVPKWKGERDEHGAFTRVGPGGRKWLAGVSAQRGY
jgi:hypothetical protein